jgi:hypothetical protein
MREEPVLYMLTDLVPDLVVFPTVRLRGLALRKSAEGSFWAIRR